MLNILMTATDATSEVVQPTMADMLPSLLLFAVMILAMYFLMIRPQKKREKQQKMMRDALAIGDTVVTIGGIYGTIVEVDDEEGIVTIAVGPDKVRFMIKKSAIADVQTPYEEEEEVVETAEEVTEEAAEEATEEVVEEAPKKKGFFSGLFKK